MKIKLLQIENFRTIRHFDSGLSPSINVFFGENGAGKSTIVLAINYLLSWLTARIINQKGNGRVLTDDDITKGQKYCRLHIVMDDFKNTSWTLYRQHSTERSKGEISDFKALNQFADSWYVAEHRDEEGNLSVMPAISVFDVNRAVVDVPQRLVRQKSFIPISAYTVKGSDFHSFFHWFREREDVENEQLRNVFNKKRSLNDFTPDIQLEAVRKAITIVMPEYGSFHVLRNPKKFVMEKNGVEFDFARLSDGEKCYITLVASIARKLAMTHPQSESVLTESGIFVVDEVDLHLHPYWQRTIVDKLREVFPNSQFVLTTHSPAVLSSVRTYSGEKVFHVNQGEVSIKPRVFGDEVHDILLRDFNVTSLRSDEGLAILKRVKTCLAKGDYKSVEFHNARKEMLQKLDASDSDVAGLLMEEAKLRKAGL